MVTRHENTVHSEIKSVACPFPDCGFKTKTVACLKVHQRIHETNLELRKPYPCNFPDCDYRAVRLTYLRRHVRAKQTPGKTRDFQCGLCFATFYTGKTLRDHIARHVKETRFYCEHCEFSTHDRGSMSIHVKLVHKNLVTFDCSFPGCSYSSTYRLAVRQHHREMHSAHPDPLLRRPVACTFPGCDYRADFMGGVKNHIRVHHNPDRREEFSCPLCSKKFFTKEGLRGHVNGVHTLERNYKCTECPYYSSYSANLSRHHKTVHEKRKPPVRWFTCQSCYYGAHSKQLLGIHVMTAHTNHRRFHCEQAGCNFKTNYAQGLRKHMLIHERDPERQFPVACSFPGCNYRRRIAGEMTMHERGHGTSKMQFKCKHCRPNMFSYPDIRTRYFFTITYVTGKYLSSVQCVTMLCCIKMLFCNTFGSVTAE